MAVSESLLDVRVDHLHKLFQMLLNVLWVKGLALRLIRLLSGLLRFRIEVQGLFHVKLDSLHIVLLQDKVYGEDRANADLRLDTDLASEELANALADAKAQANSVCIHLVGRLELTKELKELLLILLADARTVVLHSHVKGGHLSFWLVVEVDHLAPNRRSDGDLSSSLRKFYCIRQQV